MKAYASAAGPILCASSGGKKQAGVPGSEAVRRLFASCSQVALRISKLLKNVIIKKAIFKAIIWTVFTFLELLGSTWEALGGKNGGPGANLGGLRAKLQVLGAKREEFQPSLRILRPTWAVLEANLGDLGANLGSLGGQDSGHGAYLGAS